MSTFEEGFAAVEGAANDAARAATSLAGTAKALTKAARAGDIPAIRRLSDRLSAAADAAVQEATDAATAWPFDAEREETYLREAYENELLATADAAGLRIDRRDGALVSFPSIVRILAQARALRIDRRKVATLRPSTVVAHLLANQSKKPAFATERFLETLHRAYRLLGGDRGYGWVAPLATVYEALTLLPGSAADYALDDFTRDLYLLDRSGLTHTRSGARVSLPASSGTRSAKGVLTFVGIDGRVVTFYGLRFDAP